MTDLVPAVGRGRPRTAFVLAGGGSLGAVEVGMLKALAARKIDPDLIVGASVGAVNGVYLAGNPGSAGVAQLESIWRSLRRRDVFPVHVFGAFLGVVGTRPAIVDRRPLRELLERNLPLRRLEEARIPCQVVAADVLSGLEVRLGKGSAVEAVLASAAIPGIFPPVRIEGRDLIDGAIASNTPVAAAIARGAGRVIVLPTGFSCAAERAPGSALGMVLHAINLLIAQQLVIDVERFSTMARLSVIPPLCPLSVSAGDFSHTAELVDRAEKQTLRWIDEQGLDEPGVPAQLRPHQHGAITAG
jgi:NTE family protein